MKRKEAFLTVNSNEEAITMAEPNAIRTTGILSDLVVTFIGQLSDTAPNRIMKAIKPFYGPVLMYIP